MSFDIFAIIDIFSVALWIYVLYRAFPALDRAIGGRFTQPAVPVFGAFVVFTLHQIYYVLHHYWIAAGDPTTELYLTTLLTMQLVGGILLLSGTRGLFELDYLTTGFGEAFTGSGGDADG